jgi:hypothetical protein
LSKKNVYLSLSKKLDSKNIYKITWYVSFLPFWSNQLGLVGAANLKYDLILLFHVSLDASPFTEKFDQGIRIRQGAEVDGF